MNYLLITIYFLAFINILISPYWEWCAYIHIFLLLILGFIAWKAKKLEPLHKLSSITPINLKKLTSLFLLKCKYLIILGLLASLTGAIYSNSIWIVFLSFFIAMSGLFGAFSALIYGYFLTNRGVYSKKENPIRYIIGISVLFLIYILFSILPFHGL
jgi:hypothetical protein